MIINAIQNLTLIPAKVKQTKEEFPSRRNLDKKRLPSSKQVCYPGSMIQREQILPSSPPKVNRESKNSLSRRKKYVRTRKTRNKGNPVEPHIKAKYVQRPKAHVQSLSTFARTLTNFLLDLHAQYRYIKMSQGEMARRLGVSRCTINRTLYALESEGLVSNNYHHKGASVYKVTDLFWNKSVAYKLRKLLPALLLIVNFGATQYYNINIYKRSFKYRGVSVAYSNTSNMRYQNFDRDALRSPRDFLYEKGPVMNVEVKEAIEAITEIDLSLLGKSMLALYNAAVIRFAHNELKDILRKRRPVLNPFGFLLAACKKKDPLVDCSFHNPLFLALKEKHGFRLDEPPLTSPTIRSPQKEPEKAGLKREQHDSSCYSSYSDRPLSGSPLLFEHINEYAKRIYGREAFPGRTGGATRLSRRMLGEEDE